MSLTNVRVIKASKSMNLGYGYVGLHPDVSNFYIPKPQPLMVPQRLSQIQPAPPTPQPRKKSCAKRLCAGICNFFNRAKKSEDEQDSNYQQLPPASAIYYQPPHQSLRPLAHPRAIDDIPRTMSNYLPLDRSYSDRGESQAETDEDCGEYVIYIPNVSKTRLERSYLEPLRQASYDPIVIQSSHSKKSSCPIISNISVRDGRQELRLQSHRKAPSDKSSRPESQETLGECLTRVGRLINESARAYGDYPEIGNDEKEETDRISEQSVKCKAKVYLYIPVSSSKKEASFAIPEKKIHWTAIHERHSKVARNVQRMSQERMEKWLIFFAMWDRRRLIAKMKKGLTGDNKPIMACSSPNMLESRFHHIHWLGNSGKSSNSVGRYFDKEENTVVALKIFGAKPFESVVENLDNRLKAIQEITSLKKMDHKNIVKLIAYFELQDKYHLILESCDHCLRADIEEAPSGLGTSISKKIIRNILNGLNFCHLLNCLHRDLSPENILICKDGLAKIADFDRSVFLSKDGVGTTCPTPGSYVYNSPEILAGDREYGLPSDIWSIGIIFCELLTGRPPWDGRNTQSQLREIHNSVGPLLPRHASVAKLQLEDRPHSLQNHAQLQQMFTTISASCCSFIKKCLDVNPQNRFTCGELLQHPFMKGNYK